MSTTIFTLTLPKPRVRKKPVLPGRAHRDKHLYSRKRKHKTDPRDERDCGQPPVRMAGDCRLNGPGPRGRTAAFHARRPRP